MATLTPEVQAKAEQALADILPKIHALEKMSDENLADAMSDLKKALKENPVASVIILPEDIGKMVQAIRRIHGETIAAFNKEKEKKPTKSKKIDVATAEDIKAALDSDF